MKFPHQVEFELEGKQFKVEIGKRVIKDTGKIMKDWMTEGHDGYEVLQFLKPPLTVELRANLLKYDALFLRRVDSYDEKEGVDYSKEAIREGRVCRHSMREYLENSYLMLLFLEEKEDCYAFQAYTVDVSKIEVKRENPLPVLASIPMKLFLSRLSVALTWDLEEVVLVEPYIGLDFSTFFREKKIFEGDDLDFLRSFFSI